MSEQTSQQLQTQIPENLVGTINPAEADLFARDEYAATDPEVLAIHERLGTIVAEQGHAFALVVAEDEDGNQTPLKYISIGQKDAGTRVKEDHYDTFGLPEVTTAAAALKAREQQKADEMQSSKPESALPFNTLELANNLDGILEPNTLQTFTDRGNVERLATSIAEEPGAGEQQQALLYLENVAKTRVFAPEQAATQATRKTAEVAGWTEGSITNIVQDYETIISDTNASAPLYDEVMSQIPAVRQFAEELRETIGRGQAPTDEQISRAYSLRTLADIYSDAHRRDTAAIEKTDETSMLARRRTDSLSEEVRGYGLEVRKTVEDRLAEPDPSQFTENAQQASARGAATIRDHEGSCENDYEAEITKVTDVAKALLASEDGIGLLRSKVTQAFNTHDSLPRVNDISDHVEEINRHLYNAREHQSMGSLVVDAAERLIGDIQKIENGLTDRQIATREVQEAATTMRDTVSAITRSPLYAQ